MGKGPNCAARVCDMEREGNGIVGSGEKDYTQGAGEQLTFNYIIKQRSEVKDGKHR